MSYEYIKRNYGLVFEVGERVLHTITKRWGFVSKEKFSQANYVEVCFDGTKHSMPCHPGELMTAAAVTAAAMPYKSQADIYKLVYAEAMLALRVATSLNETTVHAVATSLAVRLSAMLAPDRKVVDKPVAAESGTMADEIRRAR